MEDRNYFDALLTASDVGTLMRVQKVARLNASSTQPVQTSIVSSVFLAGSRVVPSEEVDRAFHMPIGKLRKRAGIESLAYSAEDESELTLGALAAEGALRATSCGPQELDWIIATSETHHDYPALAAQLHSRLLARENCGALDVGGACLGLLNALAVAQSLIGSGAARTVAVVTADVHSRVLTPERVAGEFGGLFGDGASAFVLHGEEATPAGSSYRLGEFLFGCAGQYAGRFRLPQESAAASTCSLMGRRFPARRLRGWKKLSPLWRHGAESSGLR